MHGTIWESRSPGSPAAPGRCAPVGRAQSLRGRPVGRLFSFLRQPLVSHHNETKAGIGCAHPPFCSAGSLYTCQSRVVWIAASRPKDARLIIPELVLCGVPTEQSAVAIPLTFLESVAQPCACP
jgi:hypothetical protein